MRMTRAALRAQESEEALRTELETQLKKHGATDSTADLQIHEDSDKENGSECGNEDSDKPNMGTERIVLRDITVENYSNAEQVEEDVAEEPKKKVANRKVKKAKSKHQTEEDKDIEQDVQTESAVDHQDIESGEPGTVAGHDEVQVSQPKNGNSEHQQRSPSLESKAPIHFNESVSKTPRFNPEVHLSAISVSGEGKASPEDSFVDSITTRSPSKYAQTPTRALNAVVREPSSQKSSRSISSPRVEDSVAALDALEDALEKVSDTLPAVGMIRLDSPVKSRKSPTKPPSQSPRKNSARSLSPAKKIECPETKPNSQKVATVQQSSVKARVKAIESRPQAPHHRRATSVHVAKTVSSVVPKPATKPSHGPSKSVSITASKPMLSLSNSPVKEQPNVAKKRVPSGPLSTSKPGFVPIKSTKPTTKSTFVLPGDAIAAKLKAQREERLKREEEAAGKKKVFKARPAPSMTAKPSVTPRENRTSQARMSVMVRSPGENKENVAPAKPLSPRANISVTKIRTERVNANSGTRKLPSKASTASSSRTVSTSARVTSNASTVSNVSAASSSSGTKPTNPTKVIFDRRRMTIAEVQREKKEKEEAARRARAEAAEKGRQASREWAEKQKKKAMAEKEAKAKAETNVETIAT